MTQPNMLLTVGAIMADLPATAMSKKDYANHQRMRYWASLQFAATHACNAGNYKEYRRLSLFADEAQKAHHAWIRAGMPCDQA